MLFTGRAHLVHGWLAAGVLAMYTCAVLGLHAIDHWFTGGTPLVDLVFTIGALVSFGLHFVVHAVIMRFTLLYCG